MEENPQQKIKELLNQLETIAAGDTTKLQTNVYGFLNGLSILILEGKSKKFQRGWVYEVVDRHNEPLFDKESAKAVEEFANVVIKPIFKVSKQAGGNLSLRPGSTKGVLQTMAPPISVEDMSIDKTYWKIKNYLAGVDKQVHQLSRELGPFKFFYDMDIDFRMPLPVPIPVPPFIAVITVPIPPRAIPVLIGVFVEAIRLLFSVGSLSNDTARKVLSVVVAVSDLLQGDWKQSLLSLAGIFGQAPLLMGIIGKVFLNALSLIAPDIQDRLLYNIFQSGKSFIIGIFLWGFSTFAPDFVRKIVRAQFDAMKALADDTKQQISKVEESMSKSVGPIGLQVKFKEIPDDFIPTFDDIQNLQSIARQPAIFCSKEFQEAIAPLRMIPPARLLLELLSIPTEPDSMAMECKGMEGVSIDKTIENLISPEITPIPGSPMAAALVASPVPVAMASPVPMAVASPVPMAVASPVPMASPTPVPAPIVPQVPQASQVSNKQKGGTRRYKPKKRTRKNKKSSNPW